MTAISRSMVKIAIMTADTNPSAVAATDYIEGEITNYSQSGGNTDSESVPAFGGFIDKDKPAEQIEFSMEFVPSIDGSNVDRWRALSMAKDVASSGKNIYTSASATSTQPGKKAVFLEALSGTNYDCDCYNNADVTVTEKEHSADDNRTGNITLKLSPENKSGVANHMEGAYALSAMPNWTALDNN